ncbi:MAG: hypothetical protein K6G15_04400, partial [Desulfovibrio sp.]|nr:hypothetical protein [Desulfovibrio sp.]
NESPNAVENEHVFFKMEPRQLSNLSWVYSFVKHPRDRAKSRNFQLFIEKFYEQLAFSVLIYFLHTYIKFSL